METQTFASALPVPVLLQLLDEAPDAIIVADECGRLRFANRQAERMFGYQRGELLDQSLELLVPEALRTAHAAHRAGYMRGPVVRAMGGELELCAQTKTGFQFPVEVSLSPIVTEQGRYVASAIRDISARKRSEAAARLTSQRLLSAVESIQAAFALFDANDRLVVCNSEFRQLFVDASGEVVGRSFAGLLADNRIRLGDPERPDQHQRWLAYHQAPHGTLEVRTRDARTLRVAARATAEGGRVVTVWDISVDVARARDLQHAQAAAEAANRAKTDFLASVRHELRTPLNAVLGFAQLIARDKLEPLSAHQRERMEHILRGGEILSQLIEDVLDLSRMETGRLKVSLGTVSVAEVVRDAVHAVQAMALAHDVPLLVDPSVAAAPELRADRTRLAQVLINLGTNAIKYGKSAGGVRFHTERGHGSKIRLIVSDDGPGIPLHQQSKLLEPFHRAGQELGNIEGTGIGLALCKRLAEAMAGRVGFTSVPGRGSSFWIELPLAHGSAGHVPPSAPSGVVAAAPVTKHKVLYVEDAPSNVELMRDLLLDHERIELSVADNAEAAIERARQLKPALIIMDINLPGVSGADAARQLKQLPETKDIPIIALSAVVMSREQARDRKTPFARYLTKPVKLNLLLDTIEPLLPP